MPLARRYSLEELRAAANEATAIQGRPIMIEYLMLRGVNDQPEDLEALLGWIDGLPVHINLIPYNPIDTAGWLEGTGPEERSRFARALREKGVKATLRYSLGADIAAACGQLAGRESVSTAKGCT
jgi:23S rRNA (adenine2503-C2)-methyltransferase